MSTKKLTAFIRNRDNRQMWDFKYKSFLNDLKHGHDTRPVMRRGCDAPGCSDVGDYRAPKSRQNLRDYYWFCLEHVRQYNQSWDFCKGMTPGEMETHLNNSAIWDRPTWRMTQAGMNEEKMRQKIYTHFTTEGVYGSFGRDEDDEKAQINVNTIPHPTIEALAALGLAPPIEWEEVRTRYKALAKKYHPDTNRNDSEAEEKFKKISLAYTILKLSFDKYMEMDKR